MKVLIKAKLSISGSLTSETNYDETNYECIHNSHKCNRKIDPLHAFYDLKKKICCQFILESKGIGKRHLVFHCTIVQGKLTL